MNEHTQKLLQESTYYILGVRLVDQKKFVELIVKECITKAEEEAERYLGFPNLENADMYAKVMYNYQELLKEHFGVEE